MLANAQILFVMLEEHSSNFLKKLMELASVGGNKQPALTALKAGRLGNLMIFTA